MSSLPSYLPIDGTSGTSVVLQSGWSLLFFGAKSDGTLQLVTGGSSAPNVASFVVERDGGEVAQLSAGDSFTLRSSTNASHTLNWDVGRNKLEVGAAQVGIAPVQFSIVDNENTPLTNAPGVVSYGISYEMQYALNTGLRLSEDFDLELGLNAVDSLQSTKYRFRILTVEQFEQMGGTTGGGGSSNTTTIIIIVAIVVAVITIVSIVVNYLAKKKKRRGR